MTYKQLKTEYPDVQWVTDPKSSAIFGSEQGQVKYVLYGDDVANGEYNPIPYAEHIAKIK